MGHCSPTCARSEPPPSLPGAQGNPSPLVWGSAFPCKHVIPSHAATGDLGGSVTQPPTHLPLPPCGCHPVPTPGDAAMGCLMGWGCPVSPNMHLSRRRDPAAAEGIPPCRSPLVGQRGMTTGSRALWIDWWGLDGVTAARRGSPGLCSAGVGRTLWRWVREATALPSPPGVCPCEAAAPDILGEYRVYIHRYP